MRRAAMMAFLTCLALLLVPAAGEGQKEKVFRNISGKHLETILKEMDISFKKIPGKKDGIFFYDFERGKLKLRLHNYQGSDLWIDAIFPKVSLENINAWNQKTRFSRAVLFKDDDRDSTSLEAQLDCVGGVTEGMIRRFISRFEEDVQAFSKYAKK